MVGDWLEWFIKLLSDPDYLQHIITNNKNASNLTLSQERLTWKLSQRQDVQRALTCAVWIVLICFCVCYVASSYFRRQANLSQKIGKLKSQVAIFGRRNSELSKELMRTKSQLTLAEQRLVSKDSSMANVLEMTRLRAELEGVRMERSGLLQRLQGGLLTDIRSWSSEQMMDDSLFQSTRALELKLRVRESETSAIKQELEASKKENDTLRMELEALRKDTAPSVLAQRLQSLLEERVKSTAEVEELQAALTSKNKLLEEAKTELSTEEKKNQVLSENNLELEQKLKNLKEEKQLLESRLSDINTEKTALQSRLTLIEQEIWSDDRSEDTARSEVMSKKDMGHMGDILRDKQEMFARMKQTLHKVDALMNVSKNRMSTALPSSASEEEEQWCDTIEGRQDNSSTWEENLSEDSDTTTLVGEDYTGLEGDQDDEHEFQEGIEEEDDENTREIDVQVQIVEIEEEDSEEEGVKIGNGEDIEETRAQNYVVTTIPEEEEEEEEEEEQDEGSEEENEEEEEEEAAAETSSDESSQLSDTSFKTGDNLDRFVSSSRPVSGSLAFRRFMENFRVQTVEPRVRNSSFP